MEWKDKRHVNILTNMLSPLAIDNFYDESGKSLKSATVRNYNRCKEYVDKYDHVTNLYFIKNSPRNMKISHFYTFWNLPFSTVFSFSPLVVQKLSHQPFKLTMMRDLI